MRKTARKRPRRDSPSTVQRLLDAAEREFNAHGFEGTDTNRIAKEAGFAPQTFYRHFKDKTAIFLAVYERWWRSEFASLEKVARGKPSSGPAAARIALAFHTKWRGFRRALRHLAVVDPAVRAARAKARKAQIARLAAGQERRSEAELIGALLAAERVCDAVAEGELADLGLSRKAAESLVIRAISVLIGSENA